MGPLAAMIALTLARQGANPRAWQEIRHTERITSSMRKRLVAAIAAAASLLVLVVGAAVGVATASADTGATSACWLYFPYD